MVGCLTKFQLALVFIQILLANIRCATIRPNRQIKNLSFPKLVLARDRQQAVPLGDEFFQMNFAA